MDGEKFANVTVNNGKVISDGDRDIVIGMGLPPVSYTHLDVYKRQREAGYSRKSCSAAV